jgi:hypothetical protein
MAFSRADTRPTPGDLSAGPGGPPPTAPPAGLGPALVLGVALAVAGNALALRAPGRAQRSPARG